MNDHDAARLALRCLDLTSLKEDDSRESIAALAHRANTPHGPPAALCIHAPFVSMALRALAEERLDGVRVATVVNFPAGNSPVDEVVRQTRDARAAGAHEIDAVFPWRALLRGDLQAGRELVSRCKAACGDAPLKVILETGELREAELIRQASRIALAAGADFLKTSTGKVPVNATPEAVAVMLEAIREQGRGAGLKVAGGLSTMADVQRYIALAAGTFGAGQLSPRNLRFGASSLLPVLLAAIEGQAGAVAEGRY